MENFFIVGVSKCGTTSLHEYLGMHPEIAVSDPKETKFFSTSAGGSYDDFFRAGRGAAIRGEATPQYFTSRVIAGRIKECDPGSRIIILVRDPAERARSHYLHNVQRHHEKRAFAEVIRADHDRYRRGDGRYEGTDAEYVDNIIALGMYSRFIPIWQGLFRDVLVLSYEEFFADARGNIGRVFDFLGVDRADIGVPEVHNKTRGIEHRTLHRLATSGCAMWAGRSMPRPIKSSIRKLVWGSARLPPASTEELELLEDIYGDEMARFRAGYG